MDLAIDKVTEIQLKRSQLVGCGGRARHVGRPALSVAIIV